MLTRFDHERHVCAPNPIECAHCHGDGTGGLPTPGRSYEGYVRFADDSVISLQCFEDRHDACPDTTSSDSDAIVTISGPLEGYYCECGNCDHGAETGAARPSAWPDTMR